MNIESGQIQRMKDKDYRHGAVNAQIEVDLPLQIRALRKQRSLTQPELAGLAGMKQPRISRMEKPGATRFSLETLRRLAEAFDVALVVRFAAFSELLNWSSQFSPDNFQVPGFEQELPELEAGCNRPESGPTMLRSGAALLAQFDLAPVGEVHRAELLGGPPTHRQGLLEQIPPGAAAAAEMTVRA
jgi:transcriptional regulator with XRE-family HTH domain